MNQHRGKRLCITGIPASGKSFLARKLADTVGGVAVFLDDYREGLSQDSRYAQWVNFYHNKDEESYYATNTPDVLWRDLVMQSEGLWPAFVERIGDYKGEKRPVIFECVNLLPHLVENQFDFPGIVLLGSLYEEILERNKKDPRWGKTEHLQKLEAKHFFFTERPRYKEEGERCRWMVCEDYDSAYAYGIKVLS